MLVGNGLGVCKSLGDFFQADPQTGECTVKVVPGDTCESHVRNPYPAVTESQLTKVARRTVKPIILFALIQSVSANSRLLIGFVWRAVAVSEELLVKMQPRLTVVANQ